MKCRHFKSVLHDYLDGTLSSGKLASAESHLSSCAACQDAVHRERALAESVSAPMHQIAGSRTLRPAVRRRIVAALGRDRVSSGAGALVGGLWRVFGWPRFAAAGLGIFAVLLGLIFLASVSSRNSDNRRVAVENRSPVFIRISYSTPQYTFHQAGDLIIDTLCSRTNAVDVRLQFGEAGKSPQNERKTTLPL